MKKLIIGLISILIGSILYIMAIYIKSSEDYIKELKLKNKNLELKLEKESYIMKKDSLLILAIAMINVESNFNTDAHLKRTDAAGLLQITPIYVKEVNKYSKVKFTLEDRFNPIKNLEMFIIFNNKHNPNYNLERAIFLHNSRADSNYKIKILEQFNTINSILNIKKSN